MKILKNNTPVVALVVVVLLLAGAAQLTAANNNAQPLAEVMYGPSGLSWNLKVEYSSLTLRISMPDGNIFEKSFAAGSMPGYDLAGFNGGPAADGSYKYELTITPLLPARVRTDNEIAKPDKLTVNPGNATFSGSFSVKNGSIVQPAAEQGPDKPLDQVIADDMIVVGSLCVGSDCANGENFGFDTIRLKENNLRIKFEDTSNSASFPSNDWQLTANSSSNGGASYFAIDDINSGKTPFLVEAGAPNSSLYVDSGGRIGLGTSSPVVELHIKNGDSPTLRLEQDGSSGFTPQTWDVVGNETNFFVRDVTNGSLLSFRIRSGAPANSIFIDTDGDVGLGTASPDAKLDVLGQTVLNPSGEAFTLNANATLHMHKSATVLVLAENSAGATVQFSAGATDTYFGSRTNHNMHLLTNQQNRMGIDKNGKIFIGLLADNTTVNVNRRIDTDIAGCYLTTGGVWTSTSSRTKKNNIKTISAQDAAEVVAKLEPVTFNYKVDPTEQYAGFISEDVPELVAQNDRKSLVTMDILAVVTKVVQEQQLVIRQQKLDAQAQQRKIDDLSRRLLELENKLK